MRDLVLNQMPTRRKEKKEGDRETKPAGYDRERNMEHVFVRVCTYVCMCSVLVLSNQEKKEPSNESDHWFLHPFSPLATATTVATRQPEEDGHNRWTSIEAAYLHAKPARVNSGHV